MLDFRCTLFCNCKYSANKMATFQETSKGNTCATIRIKGYKPVSKTHRTKTLAKQWAQTVEDKMRSGTYHISKDDALSTILDRYLNEIVPLKKTTKYHKSNINNLNHGLGAYSFRDLAPPMIIEYVTERLKTVSSSTVLKEVNTLSNVYNTAIALWGYQLPINPVMLAKTALKHTRALRKPPARSRRLGDGEEERLVSALSDAKEPLLIALLTLETARRLKELLAINEDVIEHRKGRTFLLVRDNKTGDNLSIPLSKKAAELVDGIDSFSIRSDSLSQAMERATRRAGIKDLRLTDLRHDALSRLFEKGFDVAEVMAISGHKSAETLLKIYTQVKGENVSDKLDKL